MNEIGFDAASAGLMADAYAAVVPIMEIPSGILTDRFVGSVALVSSSLLGGWLAGLTAPRLMY